MIIFEKVVFSTLLQDFLTNVFLTYIILEIERLHWIPFEILKHSFNVIARVLRVSTMLQKEVRTNAEHFKEFQFEVLWKFVLYKLTLKRADKTVPLAQSEADRCLIIITFHRPVNRWNATTSQLIVGHVR